MVEKHVARPHRRWDLDVEVVADPDLAKRVAELLSLPFEEAPIDIWPCCWCLARLS